MAVIKIAKMTTIVQRGTAHINYLPADGPGLSSDQHGLIDDEDGWGSTCLRHNWYLIGGKAR